MSQLHSASELNGETQVHLRRMIEKYGDTMGYPCRQGFFGIVQADEPLQVSTSKLGSRNPKASSSWILDCFACQCDINARKL